MSFIVPVRNDAANLERCLKSITANSDTSAALELVVADNGSHDGSADVARAAGAVVLVLPNVRLGELRNRAVDASRGDILAFVDADHEIAPDWVRSSLTAFSDPRVAAVGAACRPPTPSTWVQRLYDTLRPHPTGQQEVDWLGSGNMAVRRSAFLAAEGFDTSLETCEDVDLCRKLRARGATLLNDSRLYNVHYGDPRKLRHVFFGELWRGRDNVRVSLRHPRAWRTVVSAAIPIFNLLAVVTVLAGLASASVFGLELAGLAAAAALSVVALRTLLMMSGGAAPSDLFRAIAVATVYESGRALAVTGRFGHAHRRRGPTS
ncbi:MAG: glycosyltransferase [Vicinamibacterales bacterium]